MGDSENTEPSRLDVALGGDVEVPVTLNIKPFLRARMDEIEALANLIETPNKSVAYTKKFPKHMRRRAMSQNVKRVPKRLREEIISRGGLANPTKRPRRKYRRRPTNLLSDYNRRQKEFVWLETHLWHAKRFHMIQKWGYTLPHFPNDKTYRACYRASSQHCLIQDVSYYCCIELIGSTGALTDGLNRHTNEDCGLTFSSLHIQSGQFEGSVYFYKAGKYPLGFIGEVKYFWKPDQHVTTKRTLWLWCHPSFHKEVVEELRQTFDLKIEEKMSEDPQDSDIKDSSENNIEMTKLAVRNVPFTKTPKYTSAGCDVSMVLLKDTLNRFRLTGPLSQALITQAFRPIDLKKRTLNDWPVQYCNEGKWNSWNKQYEFWERMKNISHPGQLPRHIILNAVITDPRFGLPTPRKKAEGSITGFESQSMLSTDPELAYSPIWSSEIRDEVTRNKLSTQQLNEIRSQKLIPGLEMESFGSLGSNLPALPVLLIQNPGEDNGYGSGWDVIVPCGYGLPVWLALSLNGGRAGGLKENASILRERGRVELAPDSAAGLEHERSNRCDEMEKYFALPPAKRLNFMKLGIPAPFHYTWSDLTTDWTIGHKDYYVLRQKKKLISLKMKLENVKYELPFFQGPDLSALIPVRLTLKGKGTLSKHAHICIPFEEDFKIRQVQKSSFPGPVEPEHPDVHKRERKITKLEHSSVLKTLARRRRKDRQHNREDSSNSAAEMISEHKEKMRRLWLPNCCPNIVDSARPVIGFVCDGDFSFTNGRTCGIGYVSLGGLMGIFRFLDFFRDMCAQGIHGLVRNINTRQYRFVSFEVIV